MAGIHDQHEQIPTDEIIKMSKVVARPSHVIDLTNKTITDKQMEQYIVFYRVPYTSTFDLFLIRELYLDNNKLFTGFKTLLDILYLPFITLLSLSNNNIGDEGAQLLATYLNNHNHNYNTDYEYDFKKCLIYLEYLDVSNNNIGSKGAKAISEALYTHDNIRELDFHENNIGTEGANYFGKLLIKSKRIYSLDLCNNNINLSKCEDLAIGINKNRSLNFLNIGNNTCVENDIAHDAEYEENLNTALINLEKIIRLILESKSITNLFWQECNIDDIITQYIANGLKTNNKLTHLFINDNDISNEGAYVIFDALKCAETQMHTHLKSLDLSHNYYIDNDCISSFAELLGENNILQSISMNYTAINNEGLLELLTRPELKYNQSIVSLSFGKDDIDEEEPILNDTIDLIIESNQNLFWYPYIHRFNLFNVKLHNMIMTTLLCNAEYKIRIPMNILIYIYSFYNRSKFITV